VIGDPIPVPLPAFRGTLLSATRGYLILLVELRGARRGTLVVTDALTGVERLAMPLPRGELRWYGYYRYASVTPTHLLLFDNRHHEFAALRFPTKHPDQEWTQHPLPRGAGSVSSVVDFHGRVLGVTDQAELLEFRVRIIHPRDQYEAVQLLPTTGLPDGGAFERSEFGPRLVVAGERLLLLLLLMTDPVGRGGGVSTLRVEVKKVSVHALDMAAMRWEELDDIGEYSLFVDCPGRTAVACTGTAGCGVVANRVYFLVSKPYYCCDHRQPPFLAFPPGSDGVPSGWGSPWHKLIEVDDDREWPPSQTWVYPRLFYRS
jgi:hypothetical protein